MPEDGASELSDLQNRTTGGCDPHIGLQIIISPTLYDIDYWTIFIVYALFDIQNNQ